MNEDLQDKEPKWLTILEGKIKEKNQTLRRKVSFKQRGIFFTIYIWNLGTFFTDFQPKPSTSKDYDKSKWKENDEFEPDEENNDISSEDDKDISRWETDLDSDYEGKYLDENML